MAHVWTHMTALLQYHVTAQLTWDHTWPGHCGLDHMWTCVSPPTNTWCYITAFVWTWMHMRLQHGVVELLTHEHACLCHWGIVQWWDWLMCDYKCIRHSDITSWPGVCMNTVPIMLWHAAVLWFECKYEWPHDLSHSVTCMWTHMCPYQCWKVSSTDYMWTCVPMLLRHRITEQLSSERTSTAEWWQGISIYTSATSQCCHRTVQTEPFYMPAVCQCYHMVAGHIYCMS